MSLNLTADSKPLAQLLARAEQVDAELRGKVFGVVLNVAEGLDNRIDDEMPVDTGRAAAGWGKYRPELLAEGAMKTPKGHHITRPSQHTHQPQISSEADSIWEENPEAMFVIEGTHVPYVEALDAGHSAQAPSGFIEMAVEAAQQEMDAQGRELLEAELGKI